MLVSDVDERKECISVIHYCGEGDLSEVGDRGRKCVRESVIVIKDVLTMERLHIATLSTVITYTGHDFLFEEFRPEEAIKKTKHL